WVGEIESFYDRMLRDEGIDYRRSPALYGGLDAEVKALANDDRNSHRPAAWFLQQAHENLKSLTGREGDGHDRDRESAERLDARDAELDRLEGLELEEALARLTPEEAEAWLSGER